MLLFLGISDEIFLLIFRKKVSLQIVKLKKNKI